ncbi:MAG: hypothetical protein JRN39_07960 [Nitrososphaerota archaeon]|nr:hypothetical protein [Nitrososphaerota archaeon]MDG6940319.1 hypothetical protein [Nitrososphaerota archaeon]
MRPIQWGLAVFAVTMAGLVASVFAMESLGTGSPTPLPYAISLYFFGWTFLLSLPVAGIAEAVDMARRRRRTHERNM